MDWIDNQQHYIPPQGISLVNDDKQCKYRT